MAITQLLSTDAALRTELIQPSDPRFGLISIDPERMSGAPCFAGTRVPIQTLFVHLEAGDALHIFLEDFAGVTREQAVAVLELAHKSLLAGFEEQ